MPNNVVQLTGNLRRHREELEAARHDIWKKAFMDTYERSLSRASSILQQEARAAIQAVGEYNYYAFELPLLDAASDPNSLEFFPNQSADRVIVRIRLDRTAGTIEDYVNATKLARSVVSKDAETADATDTRYWIALYNAARTGRHGGVSNIGRGNRLGADKAEFYARQYRRTIQLRLQYFRDDAKAPFWELLDQGNTGNLMPSRGGTAYPAFGATRFTDKAQHRIETLFNETFHRLREELTRRFANEAVNINELVSEIDQVITNINKNPKKLSTPQILRELEIADRKYKLYITSTGLLGLSLRPRIG